MATKYDESIIIAGGKLISNQGVNPKNCISFQRKVVKNDDPDLEEDYIEVNCRIIIDKSNYVNYIKTLEDFMPTGGTREQGEDKINTTANLIVLNTKSSSNVYSLELQQCSLVPTFDKNDNGQIVLTMNSIGITKTDHGTDPDKKDHSYIPW